MEDDIGIDIERRKQVRRLQRPCDVEVVCRNRTVPLDAKPIEGVAQGPAVTRAGASEEPVEDDLGSAAAALRQARCPARKQKRECRRLDVLHRLAQHDHSVTQDMEVTSFSH